MTADLVPLSDAATGIAAVTARMAALTDSVAAGDYDRGTGAA